MYIPTPHTRSPLFPVLPKSGVGHEFQPAGLSGRGYCHDIGFRGRADVRKGRRTKCAPDTRRTGVFGEDKRLHDQTGGRHLSAYRLERRADCFPQYAVEDLFTTLARWYDLEVFYLNPEVKDIRFTGDMDKTERFGDILRIIEQNRRVHFHVKGRTVSVSWQ